ncbi:Hypothetical predicted protein [Mytilus galloprovincialis]|uniref:Phosphatidylinositide phosphatase SAC2 n=1 Tax=Mytilus galloprovincialis TaxID=29158 RepID=A0A8B6BW85_MYTGA|nr:Hypothetical predicted protein [Mytilus galloprovincialis]
MPHFILRRSKENYEAFTKHIEEQLYLYNSFVAINLAELSGKEKAISDAFLSNILEYNSRDITYISFDFHEYCRGMKFENVSILTDGIKDIIKNMKYTWVDRKGVICEQNGVFRINCVDCLDRTNVVQTAIARIVMETQCRKLGLLPPEENLPHSCKRTFQQLWANNGDTISRQYAGTAALKGDYTRTGERKLSGMMKDGVNSANRYYLRFKDNYRQAAIDLTLGQPVAEDLLTGTTKIEEDTTDLVEREENLKLLVEDCKKMLIVEPEECLGGWSLIDADPVTGDPDRQEMDIILLLSQRAVYVAWYDDEEEGITCYQRIFLEDIEQIEIGAEPAIFKSKFVCLRLYYHHYTDEGFFHTFRTPSTRLFNNIVIAVKNKEEAKACGMHLSARHHMFQLMNKEYMFIKLELQELKSRPRPRRTITAKKIENYQAANIAEKQLLTGTHLEDTIVCETSVGSFKSALRGTSIQTLSRRISCIGNLPTNTGKQIQKRLYADRIFITMMQHIKCSVYGDHGTGSNLLRISVKSKTGGRKEFLQKWLNQEQVLTPKDWGSVYKKRFLKMSKKIAKHFIDDTTSEVLDKAFLIIKDFKNKEEAKKIMKYIIKTVIKVGILYRNDQFNAEELKTVETFKSKFHSLSMTMVSFHEVDFTYDKAFLKTSLEECRQLLQTVISRHLTDKSKTRADTVFNFFNCEELMDQIFDSSGKYRDHMDVVVRNMHKMMDDGNL